MKKNILVPIIMAMVCSLLSTCFVYGENAVETVGGGRKVAAENANSVCPGSRVNKQPPASWNNSFDIIPESLIPKNWFKPSSKEKTDISSPLDARKGVVRILSIDDENSPSSFSTGSGFGVGIEGEETAIFLTNRHVVMNEATGDLFSHIYIMLDDSALKQTFTSFGDFKNEALGKAFKLEINRNHLVECEVLYPTDSDPEFPDMAVLRAARKIENRVALPLLSAGNIEDTSDVWTIGFPGSADLIYSLSSDGSEMSYPASPESAQLFKGTISSRGALKRLGDTRAFTHNAQIDHGNSGGPLVEENGRVVGINTYGFGSLDSSSVAYYVSIYIDYAVDKLKELNIPFNVTREEADEKGLQALEGFDPDSKPSPDPVRRPDPPEGKMTVSLEKVTFELSEEGEIESIYEKSYNQYGEWTQLEKTDSDGNLLYRTEFILDERGERIKQQEYNSDGSKGEWSETSYDSNGNELKWTSYSKDGVIEAWNDCIYDDSGCKTQEVFHFSTGKVTYTDFNAKGERKKSVSYEDDKIVEVEEYDDNGNRLSDIEYDDNGNPEVTVLEEYDESGNRIKYYYEKGDYISYEECTYDNDGNILTKIKTDKDGNIKEALLYTYEGNEYQCEKYDKDGNIISLTIYKEDDFGKGTKEYDKDGNLVSGSVWEYDYDSDGFLISERYYRDSILKEQSFYEVKDIDINPLEPGDYVSTYRIKRRQ